MAKDKRHNKPLTAPGVEHMKAPAKGQIDISDGGHPGLYLRISYGGRKAWVYITSYQGKVRRFPLGVFPAMSLAEARDAWRACRTAKDKGLDPASTIERPTVAAAVVETPAADLFETILAQWLTEAHADTKPKTRRAIECMFAYNAKHWNGRPLASITRDEARQAVYAIADRGKLAMSRRFQAFLDLFFRWAIGVGKLATNPLEHLPKRGKEVVRDRTLARVEKNGAINGREIALLWRACDVEDYPLGPLIKLLLLTCCRENEIAGLRWDQIRGDELWLETDDTKNGTFHIVPLSAPAKAILAGLPRISGRPYVFTVTGTGPFTSWSCGKHRLAKLMRKRSRRGDGGPARWLLACGLVLTRGPWITRRELEDDAEGIFDENGSGS
jgi:integrase